MANNDNIKIRCIVEQCKCSGERIKKGETPDVSIADARYLVGMGFCEYVKAKDAPKPGITTKSVKG